MAVPVSRSSLARLRCSAAKVFFDDVALNCFTLARTRLGFTVVWRLKSHLKGILADLCGTERRADFWMAFSNVILILAPALLAMPFHSTEGENVPAVFRLAHQLKWSLVGLVTSVLALGAILSLFISQDAARVAGK